MRVYNTTFNATELSIVRRALEAHAKERAGGGNASETREEVFFVLGIAMRLAGLLRSGIEAELFCSRCHWYGRISGPGACPSCGIEDGLRDCRGGTPSQSARESQKLQRKLA